MAHKKILLSTLWIAFSVFPFFAKSQFYPVRINTQLVPPYSVYLSDYATPGIGKLRVILVQGDFTLPSYQLRLVMSIEWNGRIIMRTSPYFRPAPIDLTPGVPTIITGDELIPYLDSRNIDFTGYSREVYERTRALPEGAYRIIFTAYDYKRQDVQVSNEGSSFYYLSKNEPPLINNPLCGTNIPVRTPQQIIFSWLPRNTSSPTSSADTEYEFSLYEIRPANRNPNDVILTTPPIYSTRTDLTQFVYGPAEPFLIENLSYVWRVQALDKNGRDAFRNEGYSEVCTFVYTGTDLSALQPVQNLQAKTETHRKAKAWWEDDDYDNYLVWYKKKGNRFEWFKSETDQKTFNIGNLEHDTEYEVRVQGRKNGIIGPFSATVPFKTNSKPNILCGEKSGTQTLSVSSPLLSASRGLIVDARGLDMELTEVVTLGEQGWFKGVGVCRIPYLGGSGFHAKFDRIFINNDNEVVLGRIDLVSKGIAAMIEEQLAEQQQSAIDKIQQENREQWEGTDFYEKTIVYNSTDIEEIYPETDSYVAVIDNHGNKTANAEVMQVLVSLPDKAIIIEDKNGDQWVAQKDKTTGQTKITKVEGGGLSPASNTPLTPEHKSLLKLAMASLQEQYKDIAGFEAAYQKKKKASEEYVKQIFEVHSDSIAINPAVGNTTGSEEEEITIVLDENSDEDPVFKELKDAEHEWNIALIIKLFADQINTDEHHKMILQSISVENKSLNDFIAEQKKAGIKDSELVITIKNSLLKFISDIERNQ